MNKNANSADVRRLTRANRKAGKSLPPSPPQLTNKRAGLNKGAGWKLFKLYQTAI